MTMIRSGNARIAWALLLLLFCGLFLSSCAAEKEPDLQQLRDIAAEALTQPGGMPPPVGEDGEGMFYIRTLAGEEGRYLVQYGSYGIASTLWVGSVWVDGESLEVLDLQTSIHMPSGISPAMAAEGMASETRPVEQEDGTYAVIDSNQDLVTGRHLLPATAPDEADEDGAPREDADR